MYVLSADVNSNHVTHQLQHPPQPKKKQKQSKTTDNKNKHKLKQLNKRQTITNNITLFTLHKYYTC